MENNAISYAQGPFTDYKGYLSGKRREGVWRVNTSQKLLDELAAGIGGIGCPINNGIPGIYHIILGIFQDDSGEYVFAEDSPGKYVLYSCVGYIHETDDDVSPTL